AGLLLTGALHEDGLADTADALGGAHTREKLHQILKDSRIGTFGAAALGISLLLRASLLVQLGPDAESALIVTQCLSRLAPVWLMSALPYVSSASKSRSVVNGSVPQALFGSLWGIGVLFPLVARGVISPDGAAWLIVSCAGGAILCGWRFARRAGGITGDFLGATQQVTETIGLVAMVAAGSREP
ncbi:MAG TPA: adenosylcobinamide-GDP ribazoletransferase, partial [Myxococcaceae bacterium]|nr:adenosylcobinamide-GDP ribazoletransferase [Myxococcaceae bacterium]